MRIAISLMLALLLFTPGALAQNGDDGLRREGSGARREAKDELEGKTAPALKASGWLNTKGGQPLELKKLVGKVVIIDFWGTW